MYRLTVLYVVGTVLSIPESDPDCLKGGGTLAGRAVRESLIGLRDLRALHRVV